MRYLTYEGVRQLLEELRGKARVNVMLTGEGDRPAGEPASAPASAPVAAAAATSAAPAPAVPAAR